MREALAQAGARSTSAGTSGATVRASGARAFSCRSGAERRGTMERTAQQAGFLKILRDRTERRHAEERQALLVGELNHRVKNTLALVLAIVDQTWRATRASEEAAGTAGRRRRRRFHEGLRARLRALARAHDLLFRDDWAGASLADVVATAAAVARGRARAASAARRRHRRSAPPARRCAWRPKPRWRWRWPSTSWRPTPPSTAPCRCRAAGWRWSGRRRRTADAGDRLDGGGRAADRLAAEAARLRVGPAGARPRAPARRRGHHRVSRATACAAVRPPPVLRARGPPLTASVAAAAVRRHFRPRPPSGAAAALRGRRRSRCCGAAGQAPQLAARR